MNEIIVQRQIDALDRRVRTLETTDFVTNGTWSMAVSAASEVDLVNWNFHNTGPATSQFYGLKIQWEADVVDTGAGVAIFNSGKADAIYLNVAGKSGNPAGNSPTGVGIDINKEIASSSERASANSSQQGIQIYDWSTTNQGTGGPRGMLIQKVSNLNTDHICLTLRANRNMQQMIVVSGDAGYDGAQTVWRLADETTGATWLALVARGEFVFNQTGVGVQWVTPGSKSAYIMASTNDLKLKSGGTGIRLVNQADTLTGLLMQDNLDVVLGLAGVTSATAGFPHMPSHAGAPVGSPTTYAGWSPFAFDTTNNDFYIFNAGWKRVASGSSGLTGSGTSGRIAQFSGATTLGDSTLVKSGAGVLTLSAASDMTLTIPATGTAALGAGTLTVSTTNDVTGATHTHAIASSSNPGAAASLLATDASGVIQVQRVVTPGSTTNSSLVGGALEIQSYAINNNWVTDNLYYGAGGWTYRGTGYGVVHYFSAGNWLVQTAPSGTAGNAATLTTQLRVNNDGTVFLNNKITTYNNVATEGYGVGSIVDDVALTNQGADIGSTNFTNAGVVGTYFITAYLVTTTADAAAGSVDVNIAWNDGTAARSTPITSSILPLTSTLYRFGTLSVKLGSGSVSYSTSHTGSYGTAKYAVYMSCIRLS